MEGPHVLGDPGRVQRGPELLREYVLAVNGASFLVAEDELVVTLERRGASVLPERLRERRRDRDRPDALLGLRVTDTEHVLYKVNVAPAELLDLFPAD